MTNWKKLTALTAASLLAVSAMGCQSKKDTGSEDIDIRRRSRRHRRHSRSRDAGRSCLRPGSQHHLVDLPRIRTGRGPGRRHLRADTDPKIQRKIPEHQSRTETPGLHRRPRHDRRADQSRRRRTPERPSGRAGQNQHLRKSRHAQRHQRPVHRRSQE